MTTVGQPATDEPVLIEDEEVTLTADNPPVVAGLGAIIWAAPGAIVAWASDGAVIHQAPGAHIEDILPGALERADVTITPWRSGLL